MAKRLRHPDQVGFFELDDSQDAASSSAAVTPAEAVDDVPAAAHAGWSARYVITLADQIRRDLETLQMEHVPFPGRTFFEERVAAYRAAAKQEST